MTKAEITGEISHKTGVDKETVSTVIESFMECVKSSLSNGKSVYLRGFGSFTVKHREAKVGRNIGQNTTVTIPARDIPAFKPYAGFTLEKKDGQNG